jgi:hypothetical protein
MGHAGHDAALITMPTAADTTRLRPGWLTVLAVICAATVVVSIFRDVFLPASREVEVWLGFEIHGPLAYATAPIHWAIFAAGAWAFWTGRMGAVPIAAGYLFYAAISHLIWSEASPHGRGWPIGLVQAILISSVGWVLLQLRALDEARR